MKHKIISATIYGITAWDLVVFFRHFYGASQLSPTYYGLVNVAVVGATFFVVALVFSLFNAAAGNRMRTGCLYSVMAGEARLISLYMLIVSTVYSLSELRLFLQTKQKLG